ncbi:MAG: glycosyltransferase [Chloroflexota bacterium]|nr:glycosyltransferase [Chloroflexota bacterium]
MRKWLLGIVGWLMLLEKAWRHLLVVRFFRKPVPQATSDPELVSILQPILSGDPTMPACLERSLRLRSRYPLEYIWLVDLDDPDAQRICMDLCRKHPERDVNVVVMPPPAERQNPKMVKLVEGARLANGDVLCVLDDDTQIPDGGLEKCLPYLDEPGVGLAFGLPYYLNFSNLWSSLVSYFVDSHSLLTYIPYTRLSDPFTINGMFYAVRRDALERVGGFRGLEKLLADDFAVAQRFRRNGYRLAQTPLLHGISTHITGPRHYLSLIQRWFIFPRESLMRQLAPREQAVLYGFGLVPALFPLSLLLYLLARPTRRTALYSLLYFGYSYAAFAHINKSYLQEAAPWRKSWLVPLIQAVFPLQLLAALLSPQRITWRGHVMQVEPGGGFRFVRRRSTGESDRQD